MVFLIASDDNFIQHCCVTLTSLLENNPGASVYLFTEGLCINNEGILKQIVSKYNGELFICKIKHEDIKDFPMPSFMSSHISIATYYRLFAARILPQDIKKVIYLDCDIVIRGSLDKLWNTDIDNYALAAVYQSHEHSEGGERGPKAYTRLGIPRENGYFNAGVLLINLDYWRIHNVTNRLFDFIKKNAGIIHAHDQDVLNAVLHNEVKALDITWNFREYFLSNKKYTYPQKVDYSIIPDEPIVVHFVFKPKPWEYYCTNPFKQDYYKYLDKTVFSGWRPKWKWKEFKRYKLLPLVLRLFITLDIFHLRHIGKKQ